MHGFLYALVGALVGALLLAAALAVWVFKNWPNH